MNAATNSRLGRCYELAWKVVAYNPQLECRLVHGRLVNPDPARGRLAEVDHAWVEHGDLVFDAVLVRWYLRDDFYTRFQASVYATYTFKQAGAHALRTRHYGPWHGEGGREEC